VLGLDSTTVQRELGAAPATPGPRAGADTALRDGGKLHAAEPPKGGATFTSRDGRTITLPGGPAAGGATGSYIVFARRGGRIAPVPIQTGLTDQDYIEVTGGVTEGDTVLVLSSGPTR